MLNYLAPSFGLSLVLGFYMYNSHVVWWHLRIATSSLLLSPLHNFIDLFLKHVHALTHKHHGFNDTFPYLVAAKMFLIASTASYDHSQESLLQQSSGPNTN